MDLHEKRVPLLGEYNLPVNKLSRKSNRGGGGIRLDTVDQCLGLDREALSNLGLGMGSGLSISQVVSEFTP